MTQPVPLVQDVADGVMRVSGTRITLDTVFAAYREGATAEEIVQQYPSISLADVYQVIGTACAIPPNLRLTWPSGVIRAALREN